MKNFYNITLTVLLYTNMCSVSISTAQTFTLDDFNDGDITNAPLWTGSVAQFTINTSNQLQLNNTVAGTSWLATAFTPESTSLEWQLYVRLAFSGSANNYSRIYLVSSQQNLTQAMDGYYLQLGEAGSLDAIELFRQSSTGPVSICRGTPGLIANAFGIRIKVIRSAEGVWTIAVDTSGGIDFKEEATGTDVSLISGQWFGVVCTYTSGNANRFYFDDVYAGPRRAPPPPPAKPEWNDVVINEFFPDPLPAIGLPAYEFVEIFNRSDTTFDLTGWKLADSSGETILPSRPLAPKEYLILTTTTGLAEYQTFGAAVSLTAFPSLNNGGDAIRILDKEGEVVDSLAYDMSWYHDAARAEGGYTIERLNPEVSSMDVSNWFAALHSLGGTPGKVNSVFGKNPDSSAPQLMNMVKSNDSTICFYFNEKMNRNSLIRADNFQLSVPGSLSFIAGDSSVCIKLTNVDNGTDYTLEVNGVEDLAGNVFTGGVYSGLFLISEPVLRGDVILHEVMADPTPIVQLPEAEYVEIRNVSSHVFNLAGWTIEDATSTAKLPFQILKPQQYVTLMATSNVSKFPATAAAVGVTGFPSLGNAGDVLVLRDGDGKVIDSVSYTAGWYRNLEKAEGGWSLERMDIERKCAQKENWAASEDPSGGTPGKMNSINGSHQDLTPPVLKRAYALSRDTVVLEFNEEMDMQSHLTLPDITPTRIISQGFFLDQSKVAVGFVLGEALTGGTLYSIKVTGVRDCSGNEMEPAQLSFALAEDALPGEILINEILFNPKPNGSDFIELYNNSDKYIDMKAWTLTDVRADNEPAYTLSTGNDIFQPRSYLVLTPSINATNISYPASVGREFREVDLPSMPDDAGAVSLRDARRQVIDEITYTDDLHSPMLQDDEGVSLERTGFSRESLFHSASSTAGFATPGFINSSARVNSAQLDRRVRVEPEVLRIALSEFVEIEYEFDLPGLIATVSVVDPAGRLVKEIAVNELLGTSGVFHWDGDRFDGSAADTGYYLVAFEVFGLDGSVNTYRRRIVVGF